MTKLTDLCDIQYGYAFDSGAFTDDETYPQLVRIRDVKRGYSETYYSGDYPKEYVLSAGDLLIGMDGEFNIARWKVDGALLNQRVCKIVAKDNADEEFLRFALSKALKTIEDRTSFATVKHLSAKELNKLEIIVPPYDEQRKIAEILHRLEGVIESRQNELDSLDELIKARFVELFGDPVLNPFSWEMKRFDEICENLDSRRKPISSGDRVQGNYPYYGASGIVDYVEDYIFDEDILLVSEDGANLLMRSTPIAFSVSGKVWVNNHAHVVRFDKMSLQKYVEIYFSLIDISDSITGSAQPKLNQAKLNAMMIPIPEDTLLDRYCEFLYQVDKSKVVVQKALDEAHLLFDSLMQEYFE